MKIIAALSVVFLLANIIHGSPLMAEKEGRIVGGSAATAGQFPFIVSISVDDEHKCGGFIYNSRWVVTAASCVEGIEKERLIITVGQYSLSVDDPGQETFVALDIRTYPGYNPAVNPGLHNLALIEMSRAIDGSDYVDIIYYDEEDATIDKGTIMGWGSTQPGGLVTPRLRSATVTMKGDCTSLAPEAPYVANYMICAGAVGDGSPCVGDEGSPLIQEGANGNFIVGTVGFQKDCGSPSLYVRLASYFTWFNQNAGQQSDLPVAIPTTMGSTDAATTATTTPSTEPATIPTTESTTEPTTTTTTEPTTEPTTQTKGTPPTASCFGCGLKGEPTVAYNESI